MLQLMGGRKESRHNLATEQQQNTLDALCTLFLLWLQQLHIRSLGIRTQRLGTPVKGLNQKSEVRGGRAVSRDHQLAGWEPGIPILGGRQSTGLAGGSCLLPSSASSGPPKETQGPQGDNRGPGFTTFGLMDKSYNAMSLLCVMGVPGAESVLENSQREDQIDKRF